MWARCCSSRRTRPFSAMICRNFSTVLYCMGLRRAIVSWTARTVLGPRLHRTVRISSSASVGRGSRRDIRKLYYEVFHMSTVPTNKKGPATRTGPRCRLLARVLETQVAAYLQLAGVGYGVGDHAVIAVALD